MTKRRGFTLIELLIVVAIIGIIVAISVVNMLNAIQRAKQKRSMGDMKSLATGIEAFAVDQNYYPAAAALTLPAGLAMPTTTFGPAALLVSPTYMRMAPLVDGWSSFFLYQSNAARTDYVLSSSGSDGVPQTSPAGGGTTDFTADIILVDGTFVQYPEGAQK